MSEKRKFIEDRKLTEQQDLEFQREEWEELQLQEALRLSKIYDDSPYEVQSREVKPPRKKPKLKTNGPLIVLKIRYQNQIVTREYNANEFISTICQDLEYEWNASGITLVTAQGKPLLGDSLQSCAIATRTLLHAIQ